jgi:hypothetical protein
MKLDVERVGRHIAEQTIAAIRRANEPLIKRIAFLEKKVGVVDPPNRFNCDDPEVLRKVDEYWKEFWNRRKI